MFEMEESYVKLSAANGTLPNMLDYIATEEPNQHEEYVNAEAYAIIAIRPESCEEMYMYQYTVCCS